MWFNEFDPFASQWLRNMFPSSVVEERSIRDLRPDDVVGRRCHFFAGIAGWELALELAGWPDDREVWTGSCPCQPFSSAGKRKGTDDERHLWPDWFSLIRQRRPLTVFGEQVASAIGHGWLDGVFADLEAEGYTCGAVVLGAHSVGAPHIRQRLFWVADAKNDRASNDGETREHDVEWNGHGRRLAHTDGRIEGDRDLQRSGKHRQRLWWVADSQLQRTREGTRQVEPSEVWRDRPSVNGDCGRLGEADQPRPQGRIECRDGSSQWSLGSASLVCLDGRSRRIPTEPSFQPLAYGVPARVGRLRAYGNAIVPQIAAEFVTAFMEAC